MANAAKERKMKVKVKLKDTRIVGEKEGKKSCENKKRNRRRKNNKLKKIS